MFAIRVHQTGGPDVLGYEDIALPQPGPKQVRVRLDAIGVNFKDIYERNGLYPVAMPMTPGIEGAGTIDAIGSEVTEVAPGDRVAWSSQRGAYAQFAVVPAEKLVPIPQALNSEHAVAVLLQGMAAHYLSHDAFPIQPGQTVLIHAAAGGTGALLVQFAKRHGATVIGTVSSAVKAERARKAGADYVIHYREQDFTEEVYALTKGVGVAAVYDSVGKDTFEKSLQCLKIRGCLVLFGQSSGAVLPFDSLRLSEKSLFLTRPSLAHYTATRAELLQRAQCVFEAVMAGQLTVSIDRTFPLHDAAEAHRYLEAGKTAGKVLLMP